MLLGSHDVSLSSIFINDVKPGLILGHVERAPKSGSEIRNRLAQTGTLTFSQRQAMKRPSVSSAARA